MNVIKAFASIILAGTVITACNQPQSSEGTRGIGVYPGDPAEYDGPELVSSGEYRNLALHRAAWHSRSADYNLTGHLVTDGIISEEAPVLMQVLANGQNIENRLRERLFDDNFTGITFPGKAGARLELGLEMIHDADVITFEGNCRMKPGESLPAGFTPKLTAVLDDEDYTVVELPLRPCSLSIHEGGGSQNVSVLEGLTGAKSAMQSRNGSSTELNFAYMADLPAGRCGAFIITLDTDAVQQWNMTELNFYKDGVEVSQLPSGHFISAWVPDSVGGGSVTVDLGADARFDKCCIFWADGNDSSGSIEVSQDGNNWKKIADFDYGTGEIAAKGKGRFVRLNVDNSCAVSEFEIWGKGGVIPVAQAAKTAKGDTLELSRGAWMLQRASEVHADGKQISSSSFSTDGWIAATVPGTVAGSYFNAGAIPDIRYDDDQLQLSESFFNSDFWYRESFTLPDSFQGRHLVLDFNGINWKADIYLNGQYVGHIDGAFFRGRFDVTSLVRTHNTLAVLIHCNAHPGIIKEQTAITADTNGGILGADNPTFHPTIGWDWIPTVRGRDIGIWDNVYLRAENSVTIDDGFVLTHLADGSVQVTPGAVLTNLSSKPVAGVLKMSIGNFPMELPVSLAAKQELEVTMAPAVMPDARLWWPTGYGDQNMYDVTAEFIADGSTEAKYQFATGLREMTYDTTDGILDIYVNGRRLICNGGNWGFPEIYLNYRAREYDAAVAYHADMNFTMIRNWVGQTGDKEFYEACDRHGVMIWQDFWLANPWDGPDPDDNGMFMANAQDYVRRIRQHPSIALYCGRNEGYPPAALDEGLRQMVALEHPGIIYFPNSADDFVSGHGPYRALPVEMYFEAEVGKDRLHSERGMPNVMTFESLSRTLRDENHWPQTSVWGIHDYTLENAQSAATFNAMVEQHFGQASSMEEFTRWAQIVNYDGYRAMYESRSWNRKGLIIWMSHSCWPSMVWQTYDYYLCPTAAYFGAKKGSAPIRIQWNPVRGCVEVVNNNFGDLSGATAEISVVTYDGKTVFTRSDNVSIKDDSTLPLAPMAVDSAAMGSVHYLKLKLTKDGATLADNFYIHSSDGDLNILNTLPKPSVKMSVTARQQDGEWMIEASLHNDGKTPALMLRLNLTAGGEQVLPVFYEDNWFSLLPGEDKTVAISCKATDTHGLKPQLELIPLLD